VHGAFRLYVHAICCLGDALEVPRVVTLVLYLLRLYLVLTKVRHLSDALEVPRLVALVYLLDAEDAPGLDRVKYNDTGLQPGHI